MTANPDTCGRDFPASSNLDSPVSGIPQARRRLSFRHPDRRAEGAHGQAFLPASTG